MKTTVKPAMMAASSLRTRCNDDGICVVSCKSAMLCFLADTTWPMLGSCSQANLDSTRESVSRENGRRADCMQRQEFMRWEY